MTEPRRLWLLRPAESLRNAPDGPWQPPYDCAHGFVVSAATEGKARHVAHTNAGGENRSGFSPWLQPAFSTCVELRAADYDGVVMREFGAG